MQIKDWEATAYREYSKPLNLHRCAERSARRHEKTPSKNEGREIFSEKLGQLVQLQSHAALLAGSVVLVQKTLDNSLVHGLDSGLVSSFSNGLVAGNQSSVELLQVGLQLGLVSLVLLVSNLERMTSFLEDLMLGIGGTPFSLFSYSSTL